MSVSTNKTEVEDSLLPLGQALEQAHVVARKALERRGGPLGRALRHEMRRWLPYAVMPADEAHGKAILVNRYYKPLGWPLDDRGMVPRDLGFARYERCSQQHLDTGPGFERVSLFSDASAPWQSRGALKAYFERLELLIRAVDEDAFVEDFEVTHDRLTCPVISNQRAQTSAEKSGDVRLLRKLRSENRELVRKLHGVSKADFYGMWA